MIKPNHYVKVGVLNMLDVDAETASMLVTTGKGQKGVPFMISRYGTVLWLILLFGCGAGGSQGRLRDFEDSIQLHWDTKQADYPLRYRLDNEAWFWWQPGQVDRVMTTQQALDWLKDRYQQYGKVMFLVQLGPESADADNLRLVICEFVEDLDTFETPCNGVATTYRSPWVRFTYKRSYGVNEVWWETYFDLSLVPSIFPRNNYGHMDDCIVNGVESVVRSTLLAHNTKYGFPNNEAEINLIVWANQGLVKMLVFPN